MLRNTASSYGWGAIVLHWTVALTVLSLFALGLYMTDLSYYDALYRSAPQVHKSVGVLLFVVMLVRLLWRFLNPRPRPVPDSRPWEIRLAALVHGLLYLLLFVIMVSGYLISTADGRVVDVFNWFSVPALVTDIPSQADAAGAVHYWLAMLLMALVVLHALGALKHHFLNRDATLRRMLWPQREPAEKP